MLLRPSASRQAPDRAREGERRGLRRVGHEDLITQQVPTGYRIAESAGRYQAVKGEAEWHGPVRVEPATALRDAIEHLRSFGTPWGTVDAQYDHACGGDANYQHLRHWAIGYVSEVRGESDDCPYPPGGARAASWHKGVCRAERDKARAAKPDSVLTAAEVALLNYRGLGPHDRLQTRCWLPGHPTIGTIETSLSPREAVEWCLANPIPQPTRHAILLLMRGDAHLEAEEHEREQRRAQRLHDEQG